MHGKSVVSHEWKILLLAIILGNYHRAAFADNCSKANRSVNILKGQTLSVKFRLEHTLLENQSLTWGIKGSGSRIINCTNHDDNLRCSGIHSARYNLIGRAGNTTLVDLVIEEAREKDTGIHTIQLVNGSRPICTPLEINLTVLDGESPCTLMFQNESREMQMSCKWVQDTKGELTEVFFRSKLINKQNLTSEMQCYKHQFNVSENCEVKLDIQDIMDKMIMSSECMVSTENESVEKTCKFPAVEQKTINDQTRTADFECCVSKQESLNWCYVHNGAYELLHVRKKSLLYVGNNNTGFLCGVLKADGSLMVHGLGTLNFGEQTGNSRFTITLAYEEVNTTDLTCTKVVVNVSVLALSSMSIPVSPSTISPKITQSAGTCTTKNCDTSSKVMLTSDRPTQDASILISVATISAIALMFSVASCFVRCPFFHGERGRNENLLNSHAANHDGNTDHVQTIGLNFNSSQNLVQLGSEDTWVRRDTSNQSSVDRVESGGHGPEHGASSSSGRPLELHSRSVMVKQHTRHEIQEQLEETAQDVEKCEELHRGIPDASCMETAYESMDDVEDTYMVHPPPTQTPSACFHSSSEELGICHKGKRKNPADVRKMPSCLVKPNIQGDDTEESISLGSLNIDTLYAKPDLSRKREKSSSQSSVSRPVKPTTRGDDKLANSVMEGTDIETLYAKPDMNRKTRKSIFRSYQSGRQEMVPPQDLSYDDVSNPADSVGGSGTAKTTRKSEHIYENCK